MLTKKQEEISKEIRDSIVNFDVEGVKNASLAAMDSGLTPEKIIEVMGEGMSMVGKKYEEGEYFVPELIMAGETMKEGVAVLEPHITGEPQSALGTAVVATVLGDLHDIGKNIFITLLTTAGFKVVDLGVDVPAERVVEAVKDSDASIVGLSALLTTNLEQIPLVIDELKKAGLREKVKVIVGGATVTETFAREIEADGYAKDAVTGVGICKNWMDNP
jgi:5-methyltetrahydrofolate--homocysteine methyltransferase